MRPQPVRLRHAGMIEGRCLVLTHAKTLHHCARAPVDQRRERNDLLEPEHGEADPQRAPGAFGGESLAPEGMREAPADLDARRQWQLYRRHAKADVADELAGRAEFRGPQAPAALGDRRSDALRHRIARGRVEQRRIELHHARIRVHAREWREIGRAPLPQAQPLGIELDRSYGDTWGSAMPNLARS